MDRRTSLLSRVTDAAVLFAGMAMLGTAVFATVLDPGAASLRISAVLEAWATSSR